MDNLLRFSLVFFYFIWIVNFINATINFVNAEDQCDRSLVPNNIFIRKF